ncbi:unnamed protein product [Amaranthus hypochondriacus]
MSVKDYKNKPFHRRNDSGELDVFEAARYFSTSNDNNALLTCTNLSQKMGTKNERKGYLREGRVSLDVPSLKHFYLQNNHLILENHQQHQQKTKEKKKYKQPSSPGGKIAQFLNSLFSQTSSKKKKAIKSLSSTQSMKDEDELSPIGRRKRRSSISHFRSTSSAIDSRSIYSSSTSGFRTPPPYNLNTPKSYKDFKSFSEYKDVLATLSKYNIQGNGNGNVLKDDKIKGSNSLDWVDEKLRSKNGLVEKSKNFNGYKEKTEHKKFNHDDDDDHDGAESDSSSDLFELQIDYGYGFCSSGLPVYETTHMDNIKRSSATAITNGPIKA